MRQETWRMRRHHQQQPNGCGKCTQGGEGQGERKRERCHDQPESSSDRLGWLSRRGQGQRLSEVQPRALHLQHRVRTNHALPRMGPCWDAMYLDQNAPKQSRQSSRQSWKVEEYQPYQRWRSGDWFWWPTLWSKCQNTPGARRRSNEPASQQRLDGPDDGLCVESRVGARTIRSVATSQSTLPALSVPTAACGDVHPCAVASGPDPGEDGETIGASRAREWIGLVCNRPVLYTKGGNHELGWCVNAQYSPESESGGDNHRQNWCGNTPIHPSNHQERKAQAPSLRSLPTRDNRATIHENASAAG